MGFLPPYSLLELPRRPTGSRRFKKSTKREENQKRSRFPRRWKGIPSRPSVAIARRVRTLESLIPNGESMGLEGLFREAADYITCLEMRLGVMQMVVDALTGSNDQ